MFRILGLDPGIALVGYSVLEYDKEKPFIKPTLIQCGVISTPSTDKLATRLKSIREDLLEIINSFKPQAAAVELIYFTKNIKTAITVAQARGVIMESLAACGIEQIAEFTPTHLKQVLFGHGKANKKEMQIVVSQVLELPCLIKPDDAADATAIALAFMRSGL